MTENIKETGLERRSILKAAAWATPVVAVAVTAPLAAATDPELPQATWWYTGAIAGVGSGNMGIYELTGRGENAQPAELPAGSNVKFTPTAGVTLTIVNVVGGTLTDNGDGSFTITVNADVTKLEVFFRVVGPVGPALEVDTTVPGVAPGVEHFNVPIV